MRSAPKLALLCAWVAVALALVGCGDDDAVEDPCPTGQWACVTGEQCIAEAAVCDEADDCADGSDESMDTCCGIYDFICDEGETCIDPQLMCDGFFDCADISDELPSLCYP